MASTFAHLQSWVWLRLPADAQQKAEHTLFGMCFGQGEEDFFTESKKNKSQVHVGAKVSKAGRG